MHFGCHVTLCASGGFQVRGGVRGWDALGGTKVTDFNPEDMGLILWKIEEYVLVTIRFDHRVLGGEGRRPRASDRDVRSLPYALLLFRGAAA